MTTKNMDDMKAMWKEIEDKKTKMDNLRTFTGPAWEKVKDEFHRLQCEVKNAEEIRDRARAWRDKFCEGYCEINWSEEGYWAEGYGDTGNVAKWIEEFFCMGDD